MTISLKSIAIPLVALTLATSATTASASYNWFWSFFYHDRSQRQDVVEQPTITDIVSRSGGDFDANNSDFDILLTAVKTAELADALADRDANLTVLAPNDRAFIRLAQDLGYGGSDETGAFEAIVAALTALGNGDPIPALTDILLYHVVPERLSYWSVRYADSVSTLLTDATITPDWTRLVDNEPDLENARFIFPVNTRAANGFIHTINRVMLPIDLPGNSVDPVSNIVEIVVANSGEYDTNYRDYDILLNAVLAADLAGALSNPAADLTVFAPTDGAFVRLARDLGYRGFGESGAFDAIVAALTELGNGDPIPLLTDILLYHVSPDSKTFKQVTDADSINTLLANASFRPFGTRLIDNAPQLRSPFMVSNASNLRATNGVIHTIDRVLVPLDVAPVRRYRH